MKKIKISKTKGATYYFRNRGIPKGCQLCLKGAKTVLFLNGICQKPDHCSWYCPISESRKDLKDSFANEVNITSLGDIFKEIRICQSLGMSITGGEPLSTTNLNKTLNYLREVKKKFSSKFHIHLYSNGLNFNQSIAQDLSEAGLDEIRFHPPEKKWNIFKIALDANITTGAEIPVIPDNTHILNIKKLILFLDQIGADFINMNEFEYCFPNSDLLKKRGFTLERGTMASVINSRDVAFNILKEFGPKVSLKIHFCPILSKDYYQLRNRYKRRALTIKEPYEVVTDEGLLMFAQLEGEQSNLKDFIDYMIKGLKINQKLLNFDGKILKIPLKVASSEKLLRIIQQYYLRCNIMEIIPFHDEKYAQITESTPLHVYLNEMNLKKKIKP